jgi:hypothetical protein
MNDVWVKSERLTYALDIIVLHGPFLSPTIHFPHVYPRFSTALPCLRTVRVDFGGVFAHFPNA